MHLPDVQAVSGRAQAQLACKEKRQNMSRNTHDVWNGVHIGEQGLGLEIA
jgi:hypothetical protein